nr:immunoglobulin light chain junction region [Macaca mulatta]
DYHCMIWHNNTVLF